MLHTANSLLSKPRRDARLTKPPSELTLPGGGPSLSNADCRKEDRAMAVMSPGFFFISPITPAPDMTTKRILV